jgi:hypothetical protein
VTFAWHPGMALSQMQRSIDSFHEEAARLGISPVLEVSTRSRSPLGVSLSAFNLRLQTSMVEHPVTIEAAFQSSKLYLNQGAPTYLLNWEDGRAIKARVREFQGEPITGFRFEEADWPLAPTTAFYDYLYLRGLRDLCNDNEDVEDEILSYRGFTDIAFNPKKSLNCQARSLALFIALGGSQGLVGLLEDQEFLLKLMVDHNYGGKGDSLF